jgi:hypothetical protein
MRRRDFVIALAAAAPLLLWLLVAREQQEREVRAWQISILRLEAETAATIFGHAINEIVSQIGWTTQLPWSVGTMEQRRFDALRLLRQAPPISELSFLDGNGTEQLNVSRLAMYTAERIADRSQDPKFTEAVAHKIYFGPVYLRRESEAYMTVSLAGTRKESGVTVAEVGWLKLVWDVVSQMEVGSGQAYVIDGQGRLIAHRDVSRVIRGLLEGNTDFAALPQVQAARAVVAGTMANRMEIARDIDGREVLTAFAQVSPLGWLVFVERPTGEAFAPFAGK